MTSSDEKDQAQILQELGDMKQEGERLADLFRRHREDLRASAIHAVTECGFSVAKAAAAAGIDRRTLTIWLQVHNAEQRGKKK